MPESAVLPTIRRIMTDTRTPVSSMAGMIGVSAATLRFSLATERLPERDGPRHALRDFASRNANARSRADIKLG